MSFFTDAWYGIRKELSVYLNTPKLLLQKAASVIMFVLISVITGTVNIDNPPVAALINAISQIELYLTPSRIILQKVSTERETNFKEYLMVNGMTKSAYQAKITVSNYIEMFFFAIAQGLAFYFTYHRYFNSPLILLWSILILFVGGVGVVNLALFLSTLFSTRTAPNIGAMLILLLGFFYFAGVYKASLPYYMLYTIHPTAGLALAINSLLPADKTNIQWDGYNAWIALPILFASSFCFLALYLYQERDKDKDLVSAAAATRNKIPEDIIVHQASEYLVTEKSILELPLMTNSLNPRSHHYEIIQNNLKAAIEARDLKKVYPECTAVNGMTFQIYEKEIFCLLGHNGAGKSTLVNMLTGLTPKTEGIFLYDGEEVHSNVDKIRGLIGFCPQKDFLLMDNTVLENLIFFAKIKKIPEFEISAEIERIMNKLGLETFKDMPASKLSGGFKRKLNIGIALLNDPKIIIMDEPTSGMDPVSRRNFWEIIKKLKEENKTVVLTTQFLDEAEELADRIAIMSKGKLFASGSANFIKKKFGSGYKLLIQNKNIDDDNDESLFNQAEEIKEKVSSIIPNTTTGSEIEPGMSRLEFNLPFSEQSKFSQIFQELEKLPNIQISLQMVSLEEAFVSLGMQEDNSISEIPETPRNQLATNSNQIPTSFFEEKNPTFGDQISATLLERWFKFKQNKAAIFFATFPLFFILGGVIIGNTFEDKKGTVGMIVTLLVTGHAFLIPSFVAPSVKDRLSKVTSLLRSMGLQSLPYWLGNLLADMILATIITALLIGVIYFFEVSLLKDNIGNFIFLYYAFSFSMITFAYNISHTFQSFELTVALSPSIFLSGIILTAIISGIFKAIFQISVLKACYLLSFIFTGPAVPLVLGINHLVPSQYADDDAINFGPFKDPWVYSLIALLMGILQFLRLIRIDAKIHSTQEKKIYQELNPEEEAVELEDLHFEKNRIKAQDNRDPIKAVEVQKVYPNGFKALHDLTFGVEEGQVFCLLGPNGAGKTTAFEIMTAAIPKTAGSVFLQNQPLTRNSSAFYETGICSQSNTLWDYVTVEQHLKVYARFKGISKEETQQVIQYLLKALQLDEHAQKGSEKLSGGNKRKLCVAMAMVAAPKFLFLDEPSTGMDPIARRYLWTLIKEIMKRKQGAMVLTTHYMQEAELVGDKLGILINGRFATIGDMPRLKEKFGEYSVVIYKNEEAAGDYQEEVDKIMKKNFSDSRQEVDANQKELTYKVPLASMKFSNVFRELEGLKVRGKIKDFTIFTSTLEQIFINFAKNQKNKDDDSE